MGSEWAMGDGLLKRLEKITTVSKQGPAFVQDLPSLLVGHAWGTSGL